MAITLDIDGSVDKIVGKAKETKASLEGINSAYERIGETEKNIVTGAIAGQDKLAAAAKKTGKELEKQEGIIEGLEKNLKRLAEGQRKTNDPVLIKKYNTEIAKTKAALSLARGESIGFFAAIRGGATTSQAAFIGLRGVLQSTFAPLFAVAGVLAALREVISLTTKFQQTSADLQAITGANANTLAFLQQQAVEVGVQTTISANDTLEAYKLIASAKPELLENAEGLANITREAIALTEAMGGDLPVVATNLTDIMNQFNAPASEATRFVNALAAGSKEGSAEVGQLADSFLASGTEMAAANIQFEEGVGLIEAMAEKGKKGSEAGTGLRNVISKLSATEVLPKDAIARLEAAGVNMDALSDKSLSFTDRLRALAPIQNDANALVSVFGLENKSAAQILLNNVNRIDELTEAVTGTNVAYEQAAIRTATVSGEWARLQNTIEALIQGSGSGLNTFLAYIIRFIQQGVLFLKESLDDIKPVVQDVFEAFNNFWNVLRGFLPTLGDGTSKIDIFGTAVKVLNIPIKTALTLFTWLIDAAASLFKWFGSLAQQSPILNALFTGLKKVIFGAFSVISNLPAFVEGGLAAIRTFVVETAKAIGRLGDNIGNVFSEAFNIKKLITQGAGGLSKAVSDLLVNPFKDVGSKASDAFNEGFKKSQQGRAQNIPGGSDEISIPQTPAEIAFESFLQPIVKNEKGAEEQRKEAERQLQEAKRLQEDIARAKLDSMRNGVEKEIALEVARFEDLKNKLEAFGLDSADALAQHEVNKYEIKRKAIEDVANLEQLSGEERIRFIYEQARAEIDALEASLTAAGGGVLLEEQTKQLSLLRKKANDTFLADLAEFQSAEEKQAEDHEIALLELKREGFKTQADFEEFKEKEILDIRLKYAEARLALIEKEKGADSQAALSLRKTINEIKGEMDALSKGSAKDFNLFDLIGLDPNDPKAKGIETFVKTSLGLLEDFNKQRITNAQDAIDKSTEEIESIQKEIEAKEQQLEKEIDQGNSGYANKQVEVQREIDLLKQQQEAEKIERDKAVKEKQKLQKQQFGLDTLTQASSLITASAQVFQSVASIPFVGPVLGAALVGTMIASFIAAKAKVFQGINKQKAERGMTGKVSGKRHYEGGEKFGDHIEVEDGENFGILSRIASQKYGKVYTAFTKAANANNRLRMAQIADALAGGSTLDRSLPIDLQNTEAKIIHLKTEINANLNNLELRRNNALLEQMLEKDKGPKTQYLETARIESHGSSTRIIRKKIA